MDQAKWRIKLSAIYMLIPGFIAIPVNPCNLAWEFGQNRRPNVHKPAGPIGEITTGLQQLFSKI
jgi:hypothetical protein